MAYMGVELTITRPGHEIEFVRMSDLRTARGEYAEIAREHQFRILTGEYPAFINDAADLDQVIKESRIGRDSEQYEQSKRQISTLVQEVLAGSVRVSKDLEAAMAGIEFRRSKVLLDEIPGAYKDIDQVMAHARDLVRIDHTLRQIINCKGD